MITEIIVFVLAAICGLFITGYSIHMFVGGLVSSETEQLLIAIVCLLAASVIAYMAWDVIERRTGKK